MPKSKENKISRHLSFKEAEMDSKDDVLNSQISMNEYQNRVFRKIRAISNITDEQLSKSFNTENNS